MPDALGAYTLQEKLYDRKGAAEYRAVRAADKLPVLLKVLDPRWCAPRDVERLKNEFSLGRVLDTPAAVRPLAFETHGGMPVLVTEDVGGDPLDGRQEPMPVGRFLSLGGAHGGGGRGDPRARPRPQGPPTGELRRRRGRGRSHHELRARFEAPARGRCRCGRRRSSWRGRFRTSRRSRRAG